jgi:pSer/pThr/pTyr-binding forkhead associated (FHA) protein
MIKCLFCQTPHVDNTLFCSECGTYLLEDDKRGTDPLGTSEIGWVGDPADDPDAQARFQGTGPLAIRLNVGDKKRELEIPLNKAIHMGRLDPASDVFPEIDLSDDGGLEKGVSRRHARILKREGTVVVEDLGSINGTFINGKRLAPYLPEVLNDGDSLQLGRLLIDVHLK